VPEFRFSGIGTRWSIETPDPLAEEVRDSILDRVESFDRAYSRFRPDSLVTAVASRAGRYEFPADADPLFSLYDGLHESSSGAVTPLVGRSLERLGYDAQYSLRRGGDDLPAPDWRTSVEREGAVLTVREPVLIDVGAAGKGYLVDLVGELLAEAGVHRFTVDASGDLLFRGGDEQRVALEHPFDPDLAIGVVTLGDGSVCSSGSNRRVWGEGLHHILDGRTGHPAGDVIATWAIAESAMVADGLATALFFTEPARLVETFEFDYVRMFASGRAQRSAGLPGELFS